MLTNKRVHPKHSCLGVTSIEYALLAALIAVVLVGALNAAGTANGGLWDDWTSKAIAALKGN